MVSRPGSRSPATASRRRSPTSWWSPQPSPRPSCCGGSTFAARTPDERAKRANQRYGLAAQRRAAHWCTARRPMGMSAHGHGAPVSGRAGRRALRVLQYVVLVLIGLFGVAPIAYLVLLSTKRRIDILEVPPQLHVEWDVVRENYSNVLFERNFLDFIINSMIVTAGSVGIALLLGVPAAYAFSRYRF